MNEFHSEGYMTLAFSTFFPTGAADFTAPRMRPITLGYYLKHLIITVMVGLQGILASGTLPSTLKCAGMLYKLVVCTFANTLRMHAFLRMSCVTW